MRRSPLLLIGVFFASVTPALAQSSLDTMPASVVERMFTLFDRGDVAGRAALYDSVSYSRDLMVPPPGHPERPAAMSAQQRIRAWTTPVNPKPGYPRHREVLQRMVVGRFVVLHIAVKFHPPHEDRSFEKLEIYEVRNGRIVAEYDGQYVK